MGYLDDLSTLKTVAAVGSGNQNDSALQAAQGMTSAVATLPAGLAGSGGSASSPSSSISPVSPISSSSSAPAATGPSRSPLHANHLSENTPLNFPLAGLNNVRLLSDLHGILENHFAINFEAGFGFFVKGLNEGTNNFPDALNAILKVLKLNWSNPHHKNHLIQILNAGIKMVAARANRYLVDLDSGSLRRGISFSSSKEKKPYDNPLDTKKAWAAKGDKGKVSAQEMNPHSMTGESTDRFIWVMDDNKFYTNFPKLGRFHHSSFRDNGDIDAGGEWMVEEGKITAINGSSGHYHPTVHQFMNALRALAQKNAFADNAVVDVWNTQKKRKTEKVTEILARNGLRDSEFPYCPGS